MAAIHAIRWLSAAPLWHSRELRPGAIVAPDLVRFDSDDFMDELTAILARAPAELSRNVVTAVSYRARPPGAPKPWAPKPSQLRLYQPVHGHFNLVVSTLTCEVSGLPDHLVDSATGEIAGFTLRRLHPDGREMGWVRDPSGARTWQPLSAPSAFDEREELLPLFQVPYLDGERRRRLWAGLVPTSSRETFAATPINAPSSIPGEIPGGISIPDPLSSDPEFVEARARVVEGLRVLTEPYPAGAPSYAARETEASRLFLLDLADLLREHVAPVWTAVAARARPPASTPKARALYDELARAYAVLGGDSLFTSLELALEQWQAITGETQTAPSLNLNLRGIALAPAALAGLVDAAQSEAVTAGGVTATASSATSSGPALPRLGDPDAEYVVRCVYRRPRCRPPHTDVVSAPSARFTIAPFFDPDAPARPIRISLPIDTSVTGLRRFRKSVAFLMSDGLRKQMGQASKLKDLLDGKAGGEEPFSLGEICSFSIPIITLCAFIVLMIFMILLNFVFWWLPLLKFCFPIKLSSR